MRTRGGWIGVYYCEHHDRNGKLIKKSVLKNSLANEGQYNVLDQYLRGQNAPAIFHLLMCNWIPSKTSVYADITGEPSVNGYARQEITRDDAGWPTIALDSGDMMATSKEVLFVASGGSWGPVKCLILTDGTRLIAYAPLGRNLTLTDGQIYGCKMTIKER